MYEFAVGAPPIREFHDAFALCEKRVITAHAHEFAGVNTGSALANDNLTRLNELTRKALHAEHFGLTVAAVAC